MLRHPLKPTVNSAGNSDPAATALKFPVSANPGHDITWWTQSLDEGGYRDMSGPLETPGSDENQEGASSAVATLHTSFDAALLESDQTDDSIFSSCEKAGRRMTATPRTKSWDEHDILGSTDPALGELSGRKHLRQHAPTAEMVQTGTVRKLPRRANATATPGKPLEPPPGSAVKNPIGSLTPNSVAKRRQRTPFHQRKSPIHRGPPSISFNRMSGPTPCSKLRPAQALTPTGTTHPPFPTTVVKASAKSYGTGVTTETSVDTDSHATSSPATTPFRFTSFPASLPRVNNPRIVDRGCTNPLPGSIKKRMTFDDNRDLPSETAANNRSADVGESDVQVGSSKPLPLHFLPNQCRDDDGTHNSSISSWSADGGQHMTYSAPSVPPTVLEWKSPLHEDDMDTDGGESGNTDAQTKLFMEQNDEFGCSDDEEILGETVGRTRLNFNLVLSPGEDDPRANGLHKKSLQDDSNDANQETVGINAGGARGGVAKMDLSRDCEQRHVNSFPSSVSSNTPLPNVSGYDESTTASTTAFTPSRSGGGSGLLISRLDSGRPQTPEEVQIHFNVDAAQCSPIPGILEEEGVECSLLAPRTRTKERSFIANRSSDELNLSASEDSGASSTTSSKMRKLRPMPDISAFESRVSVPSGGSSRQEQSEESSNGFEGRVPPSSPKLLCPPTPVRTPAWAHADHGAAPVFARANSLIVSKVLATCPPQVLDGHSSLENSLLEDDDNASKTIEQRRASLSFSTVDEEMVGASPSNRKSSNSIVPTTVHPKDPQARREESCLDTESPQAFAAPEPFCLEAASSALPFSGKNASFGAESTLKTPAPNLPHGRQIPRFTGDSGEVGAAISFETDFENLGKLGSGTFADVYKARSRSDSQLYAIKRNRRRFRGKRDRDMALAEVRTMQRLQSICAETGPSSDGSGNTEKTKKSLYLLFFYRAWQEDGYFFCQTELCCRDTCREMMQSLRSQWNSAKRNYPSLLRNLPRPVRSKDSSIDDDSFGRLVPEMTAWKICHDVAAGLSHIHLHGVVHHDIKPSNVFLVAHSRLGAMCKIGDFGIAGDVGTTEDGQEGDTLYMAPELLSSGAKHPSADIFSLGLTLYELAAGVSWDLPSEGSRWRDLRSGSHVPELPPSRNPKLVELVQAMISPTPARRPSAEKILDIAEVKEAGAGCDRFLGDYIYDIAQFDITRDRRRQLERRLSAERGQTPRNINDDADRVWDARTPTPETVPILFTPDPK